MATLVLDLNKLQFVEKTLTNAEMLALDVTAIELIPAPGAGKAILLVGRSLGFHGFVSPAFTVTTQLGLRYDTASANIQTLSQTLFTADNKSGYCSQAGNFTTTQIIENKKIEIFVSGAISAGGGTGTFQLSYIIMDV